MSKVEEGLNSRSFPSPSRQPVRILAAIDDVFEKSNSESNERTVIRAAQLAMRVNGELHVASNYPSLSDGPRTYRVDRYLPALRVKARDRRRCAIRQWLRALHIEAATIRVEEGALDRAIDALASTLNASAVIGPASITRFAPTAIPNRPTTADATPPGIASPTGVAA